MSALNQIVGDASKHTFTSKSGKTYNLRLIDDSLMADWEKKQLARAREFESGNRELLSRDEYMERLDRLSERYHAGQYSLTGWFVKNAGVFQKFAGKESADVMSLVTPEVAQGFLLLSSLVFGCDQTEMQRLMRESGAEVTSLLGLVIKESMPVPEQNGEAPPGTPTSPNA